MNREADSRTPEFLNLLSECNRQISAYIFSMVQNFEDADDILQQTITIMWKKFDEFELGTDFASWGMTIAHYEILAYRRKKGKQKIIFSDNLLRQIEGIAEQKSKRADKRLKYLRQCLKKLNPNDLMLLRYRFEINESVKALALRTGKSIQFMYRRLATIQHILYECIRQNVAREEL